MCDCELTTGKYWNSVHAVSHVAREGGSMPGMSVITVRGPQKAFLVQFQSSEYRTGAV